MALIKCPECSNDVSDQATTCPKCGYPLQTADLDVLLKQTLAREGKISAIRLYREHQPQAGLAEAKQYVERLIANLPPGTVTKSSSVGCFSLFVLGGLILAGSLLITLW